MQVQSQQELRQRRCQPCEGGVDACTLTEAQSQLQQLTGWRLTDDGRRIRKDWTVAHFIEAIDFMNKVAVIAENDGHHPDLHIERYRHVWIEIWTHAIGGLSENDFILAAKIDQVPVNVKKSSDSS